MLHVAFRGMARFLKSERAWQSAFAALKQVLLNKLVYCRVRMEAAWMLGAGSSDMDGFLGLATLFGYYNHLHKDPETLQLKPNSFSDMVGW